MDMQQPLPGKPNEYRSPLDVYNHNEYHQTPCGSVLFNNEQCQSVNESTKHPSNFFPLNLQYAPNDPIARTTVTSALPPPLPLPNTQCSMFSKPARCPPCPHVRDVLHDKPSQTAVANENIECTNCGTRITSTWRRSADGKSECNACNLFFRKNGRKRPASMRRDTVARRYRFSRCNLCVREAEGNPEDFGQLQKPVCHRRRNSKSSLKSAKPQKDRVQSCDSNQSQSTVAQNFFMPSNPSFAQPHPTFISSDVHCSTQNPMMMNYTTEQMLFSAMNTEQQASSSEVSNPLGFTRRSPNDLLAADVYGSQVLAANPNPTMNAAKNETVNDEFILSGQNTEDHLQMEQYRSFIQYPEQQQLEANDKFNNNQFEGRYNEAYAIVKEECPSNSFLNCSSAAHESSFEFDPTSATAFGTEAFGLFQDDGDGEYDESAPVFQTL